MMRIGLRAATLASGAILLASLGAAGPRAPDPPPAPDIASGQGASDELGLLLLMVTPDELPSSVPRQIQGEGVGRQSIAAVDPLP